jgi:hypothetical protein
MLDYTRPRSWRTATPVDPPAHCCTSMGRDGVRANECRSRRAGRPRSRKSLKPHVGACKLASGRPSDPEVQTRRLGAPRPESCSRPAADRSSSRQSTAAAATKRKPPPSAAQFRFDPIVSSGPASTRARFPREAGPAELVVRMRVLTSKRVCLKVSQTGDALHGVRRMWLSLLAPPSVGGVTSFRLRIRTATEQPFAPRDSVAPECSW